MNSFFKFFLLFSIFLTQHLVCAKINDDYLMNLVTQALEEFTSHQQNGDLSPKLQAILSEISTISLKTPLLCSHEQGHPVNQLIALIFHSDALLSTLAEDYSSKRKYTLSKHDAPLGNFFLSVTLPLNQKSTSESTSVELDSELVLLNLDLEQRTVFYIVSFEDLKGLKKVLSTLA